MRPIFKTLYHFMFTWYANIRASSRLRWKSKTSVPCRKCLEMIKIKLIESEVIWILHTYWVYLMLWNAAYNICLNAKCSQYMPFKIKRNVWFDCFHIEFLPIPFHPSIFLYTYLHTFIHASATIIYHPPIQHKQIRTPYQTTFKFHFICRYRLHESPFVHI